MAGAVLAGACLRFAFAEAVLRDSRVGTPHLQPLAFPDLATAAIIAGTAAELVLTFFLVFAIFGASAEGKDPSRGALPAGLVLIAGGLVLGPLTGADAFLGGTPWNDTFVYLAGPILGALAGGLVTFRFLLNESPLGEAVVPNKVAATATVKRK
jgi:glycerol uptake facilitator-like aquaporin